MAGRPSKPVELLIFEGKSHRTKAELKHRLAAENMLKTKENYKESAEVKANLIAHKEFLRLKKLYNKIEYVDALDQQIINRYCLEIANMQRLSALLDKMESQIDVLEEYVDFKPKELVDLYRAIAGILSKIESSKKLLLAYEDRLYLNPAARLRSIPKESPKKESPGGIQAYRQKRVEA